MELDQKGTAQDKDRCWTPNPSQGRQELAKSWKKQLLYGCALWSAYMRMQAMVLALVELSGHLMEVKGLLESVRLDMCRLLIMHGLAELLGPPLPCSSMGATLLAIVSGRTQEGPTTQKDYQLMKVIFNAWYGLHAAKISLVIWYYMLQRLRVVLRATIEELTYPAKKGLSAALPWQSSCP
jgi:hypothetical protein